VNDGGFDRGGAGPRGKDSIYASPGALRSMVGAVKPSMQGLAQVLQRPAWLVALRRSAVRTSWGM
jgi:hypothetical protein